MVIGANAVIRSGTVIYLGSTIGKNLQTGHHAVIREENIIGDDFKLWNNSTMDYGCRIGDNVKIHCNCYVAQYTVLESGVFLAPGSDDRQRPLSGGSGLGETTSRAPSRAWGPGRSQRHGPAFRAHRGRLGHWLRGRCHQGSSSELGGCRQSGKSDREGPRF